MPQNYNLIALECPTLNSNLEWTLMYVLIFLAWSKFIMFETLVLATQICLACTICTYVCKIVCMYAEELFPKWEGSLAKPHLQDLLSLYRLLVNAQAINFAVVF